MVVSNTLTFDVRFIVPLELLHPSKLNYEWSSDEEELNNLRFVASFNKIMH